MIAAALAPGRMKSAPAKHNGFGIEHRIAAADASRGGLVCYSWLINWRGTCREQAGLLFTPRLLKDFAVGYTVLTGSRTCEYLKELKYADRAQITLTMPRVGMPLMRADFAYRITDHAIEHVASGTHLWVSARRTDDGFWPAPWPRQVISAVTELGADTSRAQAEVHSSPAAHGGREASWGQQ